MFSINLVSFILLHLCMCKKVFFPITAQKEACVSSQTRGRCLFCPTPSRVWDNFVYLVSSPPLYLSAEAAWDQTSAWATWLACYLYKLLILRAHVAHTYIFSVGNGHLNSVYECNLHTGCVTDTSEYLKQWETSVCPEEDVLQQQLSLWSPGYFPCASASCWAWHCGSGGGGSVWFQVTRSCVGGLGCRWRWVCLLIGNAPPPLPPSITLHPQCL